MSGERALLDAPGVGRRIGATAGAASSCGVATAALDAAWARAHSAAPLDPLALTAADAGLLAPLALLGGALVGAASLLLYPQPAPSWSGIWRAPRSWNRQRRATVASALLLAPFGAVLLLTMSANWTLELFARAEPALIPLGVTASFTLAALLLALLGFACAAGLSRLWVRPPLLWTALGGAALAALTAPLRM